ncbi:MAG TPA: hypothetical protein VNO30_38700 [Kofleriaceae bacterium]|nr:hypothetical protein [Kofleriaceae bacterium]
MLLEGWAFDVLGGIADHTFIRAANGKVFECWGGVAGPNLRSLGSANGSYNWADCYRGSFLGLTDTACIGVYLVNGVCHQSANCFLFSTGHVLDPLKVKGCWASYGAYGLYGTNFNAWFAIYAACSSSRPFRMETSDSDAAADQVKKQPITELVSKVHVAHSAAGSDPNTTLVAEFDAITRHYAPSLGNAFFADVHWEFLLAKDALVAQGLQGYELASRVNDLARLTQEKLRARIGTEHYKSLMGVDDASITLGLVEPNLVDAAGVPVPAPTDDAAFVSQSVPSAMIAGTTYSVSVSMRNTGTTTWRAGRYRLGSQEPQDNRAWGTNRIELPADVSPGAEVTFVFNIVAPERLDEPVPFRWKMVRENMRWFGQRNAHVAVTVAKDARYISQAVPASMVAGTTQTVSITMHNLSALTWTRADGYKLGAQNPENNTTWGTSRVELPHPVAPGANVTFTFPIRAPVTVGHYNFQWRLLQERVAWLGQKTPNVELRVMPALTRAAVFVSQHVPNPMPPSSATTVSVTMRNVGTATWTRAEQYQLGSQNPADTTRWGISRLPLPHDVPPNTQVTFTFPVHTHGGETVQDFQWQMRQESVGWFGQITPNLEVRVAYPLRGALFVRQNVPSSMTLGTSTTASITLRNTGAETWTPASRYKLGSQSPADNGSWGTNRVAVPHDVPPNTEVTFTVPLRPTTTGIKNFQWKMVLDGVAWFGQTTTSIEVRVRP